MKFSNCFKNLLKVTMIINNFVRVLVSLAALQASEIMYYLHTVNQYPGQPVVLMSRSAIESGP
jgi:hypothetical protein